jgi:hypothetical protein
MAERTQEWQDISTAPENGEFLVYWPSFKLDANGNLTRRRKGKGFCGVARRENGVWDAPDVLNCCGDYYGDDWEYGEPMHWMPLPPAPKPVSKKTIREAARDMKADSTDNGGNVGV